MLYVFVWLCVCCYYGESLRWHKLHSSWTKQPLYYLYLHFCLLSDSPLPTRYHASSPQLPITQPPNSAQLSLKCKHITTNVYILYSSSRSCHGLTDTHSWNIFKSLVIQPAYNDDLIMNLVLVCLCLTVRLPVCLQAILTNISVSKVYKQQLRALSKIVLWLPLLNVFGTAHFFQLTSHQPVVVD